MYKTKTSWPDSSPMKIDTLHTVNKTITEVAYRSEARQSKKKGNKFMVLKNVGGLHDKQAVAGGLKKEK